MRLAGLIAIACFAGSAVAYNKSAFAAGGEQVCVVFPFGECETILANGWSVLMQGYGHEYNLEAAVATFVPLLMVYTLVMSLHNPRFTMLQGDEEGNKHRKISPGGWMYFLAFLAVVGVSAMTIMEK